MGVNKNGASTAEDGRQIRHGRLERRKPPERKTGRRVKPCDRPTVLADTRMKARGRGEISSGLGWLYDFLTLGRRSLGLRGWGGTGRLFELGLSSGHLGGNMVIGGLCAFSLAIFFFRLSDFASRNFNIEFLVISS